YSAGAWHVSIPGDSIGLGVHQAQISAWLYGYSVGTNTTNGLNVTLGPNVFIVSWEPIILTVSYVEHINISVIYTHEFNPILDATVRLTLNGTITYDLVYEPTDEMYHLMLNVSDVGLGIWNATISANKTGYAPGAFWDIIQVNKDDASVDSSWMIFDTDYVTSVPLSLNLSSSDNEYVISANVNVEILGTSIPTINHGNGTYGAILGPLLNIGVHTVNITFSGFWFNTVSVFLSLNVSQTDTVPVDSITLISNSVIYYDETTLIEFSYQMLNGSIVPGGLSLVYVNGFEEPAVWNIDHWELVLSGLSLGLGLHDVMINVSTYGYTSTTYEFQITVNSIPTLLEIQGRYWLYINDTSQIRITFRDARSNDPVVADSQIITWASAFNLNTFGNNTYELIIQSTGLHFGLEILEFEFLKVGYDDASGQQSIALHLVPVSLILDSMASQYENETITITAQLIDAVHSTNVYWADISLQIEESEYIMVYDSEQQEYVAYIYLNPSFTPGEYVITLNSLATDCEPASDNITLTVMEKSTFELNIEVPIEARAGDVLVVSISLTDQSQPLVGITVMLQISWTMIDETLEIVEEMVTTNSSGQGELTINVPDRAIEARIQAQYLGTIDSWPVVTEEEVIAIESGGSDPLSFIIDLLKDPVTLTLVVGTPAMSVAGLALLRRRRRSPKSPSSVIPRLDTPSTSIIETAPRFSISQIDPESPIFYRMEDGGTLVLSEVGSSLQETLNEVGLSSIDYTTFLEKIGLIAGIGVLGKAAISSPKTDISQYLMEQIKTSLISNDVGLTRRELAEHLGISMSNIGKIVKELIESDIGFYEVREGSRRLIRHSDSA
ncbi:MAG: winged helix-turn-helix domain-containing protein, partial [Candidatus Thorarchaeota archaeon]